MARADRRVRKALDESYRYWRRVEKNGEPLDLFVLANSLKTLNYSLGLSDQNSQFKLTRQLWNRIHQALFDKLITHFPGYVSTYTPQGAQVLPKSEFPDEGFIEFHPDGCRRADDNFRMEIRQLYPATLINLSKAWRERGAHVMPQDFGEIHCTPQGCIVKPVVFGVEILEEESTLGRQNAYHEWWELYWHAYCTKSKQEKNMIYRRMDELESIWGSLYY